jgi:signal transduction histidine kinase
VQSATSDQTPSQERTGAGELASGVAARLAHAFLRAPSFFAILKGRDLVFEAVNDACYQVVGHRDLVGKRLLEALPEIADKGFDTDLSQVIDSGIPYVGREVKVVLQRGASGQAEERVVDLTYLPLSSSDDSIDRIIVYGEDVTESVHARRALEHARDRAERLYQFTTELSLAPTLVGVADAAIAACRTAFPESVGTIIARRTADAESVEILAVSELPGRIFENWRRFPVSSHSPLAESVRNAEVVILESRDAWQARYPDLIPLLTETGHAAQIIAPLIVAGDCIGAIGIAFSEAQNFSDEQIQYAASLAHQCAVAMERARLFELEREARAAAEKASRFKSQFLGGLSHELRTPLNAIGGYAELMEMNVYGPLTADQATALERIQASRRHLQGLIDQVLELTRIEAGMVRYTIDKVSLADLIETCEVLTGPQIEAKRLHYSRDKSVDDVAVLADAGKMRQIVVNLLTNAVKYTADGGEINLAVKSDDSTVSLSVSDTGRGIAEEMLELIFEPFVQLNQTAGSQSGVGLGLAISRNLARGMGGELTAASTAGRGSCFTLTVPRG